MSARDDVQQNVSSSFNTITVSHNQSNPNVSDNNDNAFASESRGAKPKVRIMNIPNSLSYAPKLNNNSLIHHYSDDLVNDPYISQDNVDAKNGIEKCLSAKVQSAKCIACYHIHENSLLYKQNGYKSCQIFTQHNCEECESNVKVNNTSQFLYSPSANFYIDKNLSDVQSRLSCTSQIDSCRCISDTFDEGDIPNLPSSSGMNIPPTHDECNSSTKKLNLKRPAPLRERRNNVSDPDESSDTGNDEASFGSDDCCIYTYRGADHLADLPNSLFGLEMGVQTCSNETKPDLCCVRHRSRSSSPEMDYLEMDFDPGPGCEIESGSSSSSADVESDHAEIESTVNYNQQNDSLVQQANIELSTFSKTNKTIPNNFNGKECGNDLSMPGPSHQHRKDLNNIIDNNILLSSLIPSSSEHVEDISKQFTKSNKGTENMDNFVNNGVGNQVRQRTCASWPMRECVGHQNNGDLISPRDIESNKPEDLSVASAWAKSHSHYSSSPGSHLNLSSALFHCLMAKKLMYVKTVAPDGDSSNVDGMLPDAIPLSWSNDIDKTMIWSEQEAVEKQVTQISTSACGATAVINALIALNFPIDIEKINKSINTQLRDNDAPLPQYLFSRSKAGCTHRDIMRALEVASDNQIVTKFFPFYPERVVALSYWLAHWISNGCIPIATLNLQMGSCYPVVADAWHHQMVFGVGPQGVYLTNPLQCVSEGALWHQLCSESVLLVRNSDIISRWNKDETDLKQILKFKDKRWQTTNVLGQLVNLIRESVNGNTSQIQTSHVRIPAQYKAGITLVAHKGSNAAKLLENSTDLPELQ